ncbi:MAG: CBS domain-containing protein [Candidatus Rokubacteria bacterium]|nr:CBS domain-containing protein [Candidatus Rokubacteria bacterium]
MLVQDIMNAGLVTVTPRTSLPDAVTLTRERGTRHLPVLDGDTLAGIVSDRDLKRASPVEEAARLMVKEKISALPVTDAGRLVGIVTETDVMQLFVRALGAGEPSSRLDVLLGRERTALADMVTTLEQAGVPISSIMTLVDSRGSREAIVRIATINPNAAVRALEAKGYAVRGPWST